MLTHLLPTSSTLCFFSTGNTVACAHLCRLSDWLSSARKDLQGEEEVAWLSWLRIRHLNFAAQLGFMVFSLAFTHFQAVQ